MLDSFVTLASLLLILCSVWLAKEAFLEQTRNKPKALNYFPDMGAPSTARLFQPGGRSWHGRPGQEAHADTGNEAASGICMRSDRFAIYPPP